jgi:hypothetical protein
MSYKTNEEWIAAQPDVQKVYAESGGDPAAWGKALQDWQMQRPNYVNPIDFQNYEQYAGAAGIRDEGGGSGQDLTNRANFYGMTTENYQNALSGDQTKPMGQYQSVYGNELLSPLNQIAAQTARAQGIGEPNAYVMGLAKQHPDAFNAASQKWHDYLTTTYPGTLEYESALSGPMQYSSTGVKAPAITNTSSIYILDPRTNQIIKNPNYKPLGGLPSYKGK